MFLGLDIGTTTVTAVVVDAASGDVVRKATAANDAETTSNGDRRKGRSEWDVSRVVDIVRRVMREAADGADVRAIGVTGQMHGMLLVDGDGEPVGPFIGWQDQRAAESADGSTYLARMVDAVDAADPKGDVCRPKAGYLGATLCWLRANDAVPTGARAVFLPDFIVSRLTSSEVVTEATNAAGSGLFDVRNRAWHDGLIGKLGLERGMLPDVVASGSSAGTLSTAWADTGIDEGVPVCAACGDNQASFLGSVRAPDASVLINVGTGGQVSVSAETADAGPGLEARPHVDGRYILVGAGLVGGRTYAWLRDFFVRVGRDVLGVDADPEAVYERMTALAAEVTSGADGLRVEPLLTGTREEPGRRGVIDGVGTANFSPGHVTRALLEGMIEQFRQLYANALAVGAGERGTLVGAGNGIRKNAVLREIAEGAFDAKMRVPRHTEEAAYGAAMLAMVAGGGAGSLDEALGLIQYE